MFIIQFYNVSPAQFPRILSFPDEKPNSNTALTIIPSERAPTHTSGSPLTIKEVILQVTWCTTLLLLSFFFSCHSSVPCHTTVRWLGVFMAGLTPPPGTDIWGCCGPWPWMLLLIMLVSTSVVGRFEVWWLLLLFNAVSAKIIQTKWKCSCNKIHQFWTGEPFFPAS